MSMLLLTVSNPLLSLFCSFSRSFLLSLFLLILFSVSVFSLLFVWLFPFILPQTLEKEGYKQRAFFRYFLVLNCRSLELIQLLVMYYSDW